MGVCAATFVTSSPCNLIEMPAEPRFLPPAAMVHRMSRFTHRSS